METKRELSRSMDFIITLPLVIGAKGTCNLMGLNHLASNGRSGSGYPVSFVRVLSVSIGAGRFTGITAHGAKLTRRGANTMQV
jgi:hypothetical protein